MSIPSSHHPLLALVDANKNSLKCALVKYIDVTVEQQFGQLRNRIVHMIESGEIVDLNASDQQSNTSNTLSSVIESISDSSLVSTINSEPRMKLECHDSSSISIPINVNDAPKDDEEDDDDDDEDDDDDDDEESELISDFEECVDCVNGICGLGCENDDAHDDAHTGVDMQSGLGQDDQPNGSVASGDFMQNRIDDSNQSAHSSNDSSILTNESEQQQIRSVRKSSRSTTKLNSEKGQSAKSVIELDHHQQTINIPSTSGLRLSGRNRIQRKVFGDAQSNGAVKSVKRKSMTRSSKTVKKMKQPKVDDTNQEEEEETKIRVLILKMKCTELGCKTILNSNELWKQHLSSVHGQLPFKHLYNNARQNQHGQTEYPCTECDALHKSRVSHIRHWGRYHLAGKYKCSICEFVANFRSDVFNHYQKTHLSSKFQCTQQRCNQAFKFMTDLEKHQRIHSGTTPYRCTWDNCQVSFNQIGTAIAHVRVQHFRLPRTVKKQKELNIIDERDAKVYIQVSRG